MILKKFQLKNVGKEKLFLKFKRNLHIVHGNKEFKKTLRAFDLKNVNAITNHPVVVAESKDGDMYLTNLTSSVNVKGKDTILVGVNPKTGNSSNLVQDVQIVSGSNNTKILKVSLSKDTVNTFPPSDLNEKLANTIGSYLELKIGKELKNKNLESVSNIKLPLDKN
jgi:hypothetical protein